MFACIANELFITSVTKVLKTAMRSSGTPSELIHNTIISNFMLWSALSRSGKRNLTRSLSSGGRGLGSIAVTWGRGLESIVVAWGRGLGSIVVLSAQDCIQKVYTSQNSRLDIRY